MFKNNFDTKQRFGIRKSTKWKTAGSVLLGTYAILSLNTGLASADEVAQPVAIDPAIAAVQPAAETNAATTAGDAVNAEATTPVSEAAPTVAEPATAVTASEPAAEVAGISPDVANTNVASAPAALAAEDLAEPVEMSGVIADQPEIETNVDLSFERIGTRDTSIGDNEAYSGETLDFYANITVSGVRDTYKDAELVLTLQKSDLINSLFGQESLSGYGQNQPVKALDSEGNKTYTVKLGDLISGQSISLPFKFAFRNNIDAGAQATLALEAYAVVDGKRTLISSAETTVTNRTIPKPKLEIELANRNVLDQFDESGVQMFNAGNVQDKNQDGLYETVLSNNTQTIRYRLLNADEYSDYMKKLINSNKGGDASFISQTFLKEPGADVIVKPALLSSPYKRLSSLLTKVNYSNIVDIEHVVANLNGSLDGGVVTLEMQDENGNSLSNQVRYHRQFTAVPYTYTTEQGTLSMKGSSALYHRAIVAPVSNQEKSLIPDTGRIDSQSAGIYRNELSASEESKAPSNGDEFSGSSYITRAPEITSPFKQLREGQAGYALASTYEAFPNISITANDPSAVSRLLISESEYQKLVGQAFEFKSVLTVQNNNNLREATDTLLFKNTFGVLSNIRVVANMKDGTSKTIELSSQTEEILTYEFNRLEGVENVTITGQADITKLFETDDKGNRVVKSVVIDSEGGYESVYLGGNNKASLTQDELTKLDAIALKSTLYGSYLNTSAKDYARTTSVGTTQYTLGSVEVTNSNRELYDVSEAVIRPAAGIDQSGTIGRNSTLSFMYQNDTSGAPEDYAGLISLYYIPDGYEIVSEPEGVVRSESYKKSGYTIYEKQLASGTLGATSFIIQPTTGLMSLESESTTSQIYHVIIDPARENDFITINTDPNERSFTDDLLGDGWNPADDKDEGVTSAIQTVILPKTIFIYNKNTYTDAQPAFTTYDMESGSESRIVTTLGNSSDLIYKDLTVITTIPQLGDDTIVASNQERGSEFTTTMTGPVTPPAGWTVEYTTTPLGQSQEATKITDWNATVDDFSQVTAVRYKSQPGTTLSKATVEFPITVKVPDNAKPGQKYVSTSAVSNNGSELYLEGYRTISEVKRTYGSVVVKYVDTKGNQLTDTIVNQPVNTLTGTEYTVTAPTAGQTLVGQDGKTYTFVKYDTTSAAESGEVGVGQKEVRYIFATEDDYIRDVVRGTHIVRFVDTQDVTLAPSITTLADEVLVTTTRLADGTVISSEKTDKTFDARPVKKDSIEKDGFVYEFVRVDDTENGTLQPGMNYTTYMYAPAPIIETSTITGSINLQFVDTEGNTLQDDVELVKDAVVYNVTTTKLPNDQTSESQEPTNATFDTSGHVPNRIGDFILTTTTNPSSGLVAPGEKTYIYVYRPAIITTDVTEHRGSVDVAYVDEAGNELAPTVMPVDNELVKTVTVVTDERVPTTTEVVTNAKYDVTSAHKDTIIKDGFTYDLLTTEGSMTGDLVEGVTHIKLIYQANPIITVIEDLGSVVVKYVDENGREIKQSVQPVSDVVTTTHTTTTTPEGSTTADAESGATYDVTAEKVDRIEFEGSEYVLLRTEGSESGILPTGETTITHVYHEVVTEIPNEAPTHEVPELTITRYITEAGEELSPVEEGTQEPKEFDGYTFEGTETDESITTHIYHKVVTEIPNEAPTHEVPELTITRYITEAGEELSPVEEGRQEPKEFDGYTFEGTDVDGPVTTHTYHKVVTEIPNESPTHSVPELQVTRYITEGGEELTTTEEGTQEPKAFDGYTFESTEVDGPITTHVYHEVVTEVPNEAPTHSVPELQVTRWVTEEGEELSPTEEGSQDPREFEGYTFESTTTDGPVTTHTYHKVVTEIPNESPTHSVPELTITRWIDEDGEELTTTEEGTQEPKEFDGYTFEGTEVDGPITTHVYHKVVTEIPNEAPTHEVPALEIPTETPEVPETPATPEVPETPEAPAEQPQEAVKSAPVAKAETAPLPETGDESNLTLTAMGLMLLGFVGIRKRRKD